MAHVLRTGSTHMGIVTFRRSAANVSRIGGGRPSRQIAAYECHPFSIPPRDSDNHAAFQETTSPVRHTAEVVGLF